MKMIVILFAICAFQITVANLNDQTQIERYNDKVRTYQLDVPGKEPITIIETASVDDLRNEWNREKNDKDDFEMKNFMTHIIHDVGTNRPRCYGPSCQEGFNENEGPQEDFDDYVPENSEKFKDFRDFSKDRLQAINALAEKLKNDKHKMDRYSSISNSDNDDEEDDNGKVYTSWNRLKVKQHKHPFDDKDGWVTLEPVAWSTSKISKWKPNIKKQKPHVWNQDEDNNFPSDDRFTTSQGLESSYTYPQKRPILTRPGYINNKLHIPPDYEPELPSKPTWTMNNKPQQSTHNYHTSWSPDDSRRPHKPNCDSDDRYPDDDKVYYGMSDSIVTDSRPSNFPYEYEALHQASSQKRPMRRPTQVIYAGTPELDGDRSSRPPYGDGQWVLLSTTKGYRNKKRQRSLNPNEENLDAPSITSHQSVALTVLPVDSTINMTTSHGGLLEVERSFQTVEESKRDMDKKNDLEVAASQNIPMKTKVVRRKFVPNKNSPDSSTVLAAVGAGMLPATMAMVVPMMLGRRRRKRDISNISHNRLDDFIPRFY